MLIIANSMKELDFRQLCYVYAQSNSERGVRDYSKHSVGEQIIFAEQDFYQDLQCFLLEEKAFYAIWAPEGHYVSALRMEPYLEGFLLEGLETAPSARRNGYARALINAVLSYMSKQGDKTVYSHVKKENRASLAAHLTCGFTIWLKYANYVDGSISQNSYTLKYEYKIG